MGKPRTVLKAVPNSAVWSICSRIPKTAWREFYSFSTSARLPGWTSAVDLPRFMAVWDPLLFVGCAPTSSPKQLPSFPCP